VIHATLSLRCVQPEICSDGRRLNRSRPERRKARGRMIVFFSFFFVFLCNVRGYCTLFFSFFFILGPEQFTCFSAVAARKPRVAQRYCVGLGE